jgi:choline dehydrogenase
MLKLAFQLVAALILGSVACESQEFDYIVVGAGPTGIMTAMGLAKAGYSTLIIEAGTDNISLNTTVPGLSFQSLEDQEIAWNYHVKHYPENTGKRQRVLYPKASGVGGCSIHNAMIHVMANSRDFRQMVELTNDEGWSESSFRKYFNRIAYSDITDMLPLMKVMNHLGPVTNLMKAAEGVMTPQTRLNSGRFLRLSEINMANFLSIDLKLLDIVEKIVGSSLFNSLLRNGLNQVSITGNMMTDTVGDMLVPFNSDPAKNGGRRYGVREHLLESKGLPITIWTNTLVTRVILDNNRRAVGVEYLKGKHLYRASVRAPKYDAGTSGSVNCRKEVIISAGTFNTPQILMLSGIGDPEHLQSKGIKPIVNLPGVGKNLHDRYEVSVNYEMDSNFKLIERCKFSTDPSQDPCLKQFLVEGTGPYSSNGILAGRLTKSRNDLEEADLFTLIAPCYFTGYREGMLEDIANKKNMMTMLVLKAHTNSKAGWVKLNTNNPRDMPDINFNYFAQGAEKDLPAIIKGIRDARARFAKLDTQVREVFPGKEVQTDEQIAQYIMSTAWGHHASGTSKMGMDNMSVIDTQFRVHGVSGLRVADLSIFPDLPGYFPVLTLYLTGMKAADTILNNN